MRHEAQARAELPAVGDWVAVRPGAQIAVIVAILPRSSAFLRKVPGETTGEQVVAANVDTVFLMAGSRGRHTTTHRELVPLPGGALLLDTPGMRELQLWGDASGLEEAFADIAALAEHCRFRDCGHAGEPGCAVQAAVDRGGLDAPRLASWHKLQRELRRLATRQDARARAAEQARWKEIAKTMKHHPKAHRWR